MLSADPTRQFNQIHSIIATGRSTEATACQTDFLGSNDFQAELIKRIVDSIQKQLPNYTFSSALTALYCYFHPKQKVKPQPQTPIIV